MYLVGRLCFPTLEKWSFVGDVLCNPVVYSPLVTSTVRSRDAPYVCCMSPLVVVGCGLIDVASPVWLVARPCLVWRWPATSDWGWDTRWWLVVELHGVLVLVLAHWWAGLGLRGSWGWCQPAGGCAGFWQGRLQDCCGPRAAVLQLVGGARPRGSWG